MTYRQCSQQCSCAKCGKDNAVVFRIVSRLTQLAQRDRQLIAQGESNQTKGNQVGSNAAFTHI
ncbi:hypothetical protein ACWATR_31670 [Nostoc sp. UIC 10890]